MKRCALSDAEPVAEEDRNMSAALDEEIGAALFMKQTETVKDNIKNLHRIKSKQGNSGALFKLQGRIVGPKAPTIEEVSLLDPKRGRENFCCKY